MLSQALMHASPQKPGPTIPLGGIIYSSRYFWFALFIAFWCTHCTRTLKKQATEHKVKWRFICWKINIKKLTISHLSQVSCIRLVLPTSVSMMAITGLQLLNHSNYFISSSSLSLLIQHAAVIKYYLWRIKVVQGSHGLTTYIWEMPSVLCNR